jgi:predicted acylesterase/phospholipase RssA
LDALSLQEEVCNRQLILALGGGGGSGYGYAGAMRTLHYSGIPIEMIAGTSIGSLIGMFRSKIRVFDQLPMLEAVRSLKWSTVLRVLNIEHRYGVPATLRLYLRSSLDNLLQTKCGRSMRFSDCEIPLLVVATGLTVDAFKHDLSFYEHLMDDAFVDSPRLFRQSSVRRIFRMTSTLYEFLSNPNALREVVFGADELTAHADVIDAAGFSSAVTGLLHYDVLRDDPRMTRILDKMYGAFGITRLTEGGLVNNVPVKPLLREVMRGRIRRRNPFVLALDCFSPQLTSMWYPVQKMIVPNVLANVRHADQYVAMRRRLAPINVVPTSEQAMMAMDWTSEEMQPLMPFVTRMCSSHANLPYEKVSL